MKQDKFSWFSQKPEITTFMHILNSGGFILLFSFEKNSFYKNHETLKRWIFLSDILIKCHYMGPFKKYVIQGRGRRVCKKSDKKWYRGQMVKPKKLSMHIFSPTQFSLLYISCGSDHSEKQLKIHPRGYRCVWYSYISISKTL